MDAKCCDRCGGFYLEKDVRELPYDSFDEFMAETRHQPGYIRAMLYKAYLTGYEDGIAYGREHPLP